MGLNSRSSGRTTVENTCRVYLLRTSSNTTSFINLELHILLNKTVSLKEWIGPSLNWFALWFTARDLRNVSELNPYLPRRIYVIGSYQGHFLRIWVCSTYGRVRLLTFPTSVCLDRGTWTLNCKRKISSWIVELVKQYLSSFIKHQRV